MPNASVNPKMAYPLLFNYSVENPPIGLGARIVKKGIDTRKEGVHYTYIFATHKVKRIERFMLQVKNCIK